MQGLECKLFDLCLGLGIDALGPSELHFAQLGLIPESESVLQSDTGSDTDVSGAALVSELLTEGNEVGGLSGRATEVSAFGILGKSSWLMVRREGVKGRHIRSQPLRHGRVAVRHCCAQPHLARGCSATPDGRP